MKTEYTTLLLDYKFYDIYWVDVRIPGFTPISESESSDEEQEDWIPTKRTKGGVVTLTWSETIEQITLFGFDQVMAISEESINALFKSWWVTARGSEHCLSGWSHKHWFNVTFRPARVQLISGNRAVIWVTVDDGHLLLEKWVAQSVTQYSACSFPFLLGMTASMIAPGGAWPTKLTSRLSNTTTRIIAPGTSGSRIRPSFLHTATMNTATFGMSSSTSPVSIIRLFPCVLKFLRSANRRQILLRALTPRRHLRARSQCGTQALGVYEDPHR
jgi:hypothetical protein